MIDPISAIAMATTAFNTIKKGFEVGRDIESMYGDVGRWMGAVSDIDQAAKMNKKPPLFKKIFAGSSIEEEAMNIFAAKKKAEAMEQELRQYVNMVHGPGSWNEILQLQATIRKDRQKQVYAQEERRREIFNAIGLIALVLAIGGLVVGGSIMMIDIAGHPRTW
jgi:phosphate starvation-inducible protein PhoH